MVKKIISKKHRGIKDPFLQQEKKFDKIKDKLNKPPKDPDIQELPKRFIELKNLKCSKTTRKPEGQKPAKKTQNKKHDIKNSNNGGKKVLMDTSRFIDKEVGFYPKDGRPFKPVPSLQQMPKESKHSFLSRVEEVSKMVLEESKFETRYNVDVERDEFGQVLKVHRRLTKDMERKKEKKRLKDKERKLKKKLKKSKGRLKNNSDNAVSFKVSDDEEGNGENPESMDTGEEELFKRDEFKFGETVHRPPTLDTTKLTNKIKERDEGQLRVKNFIFIQNLTKERSSQSNPEIRKKVLELEREKAVLAYRQLKAQKNQSNSK